MSPTTSIVISAHAPPDRLRTCLNHLAALEPPPLEVVVVDASTDNHTTQLIAEEFPGVRFIRNESGAGTSRRRGYTATTGDIVAFLDDGSLVDRRWLEHLLTPYADPRVMGVGGRSLTGVMGEETESLGDIGRLLPDGRLTDNFGADPGRTIEVDHLPGGNMSFRRTVLEAIDGFRGPSPGGNSCEASNIALRVRRDGGTLVFQPDAITRRVTTQPDTSGRRFDRRRLYARRRNHIVLLVQVFGWRDPVVRNFARTTVREQRQYAWLAASHLRSHKLNGEKRTLLARAGAAITLTGAIVELAGLAAGFPAAFIARRRDHREKPDA